MKVFWIGPYRPIPGGSGADLRSYYLMRELARRGVSLEGWFLGSHGDDCERFLQRSRVTPVPTVRGWLRAASRRLRGVPLSYGRFFAPRLRGSIPGDRLLYVDHLHMAVNRPTGGDAPPVWLDEHNLEHRLWEEYLALVRPAWGPLAGPEVRCVRDFEVNTLCAVDGAGLPAMGGTGGLPGAAREHLHEVPNGVPDEWIESGRRRLDTSPETPMTYGFIGGYRWPPNRLGVQRFLDRVWGDHLDRFPGDRLLLAGEAAPAGWSKRPGVEVLGHVSDSAGFFGDVDVLVVPLEMGAGTRLKVLEAAARGVAFLSTRKGVEGLSFPAVDAADTVSGLGRLMETTRRNPGRLDEWRRACHDTVRQRYRWETVGAALFETLGSMV